MDALIRSDDDNDGGAFDSVGDCVLVLVIVLALAASMVFLPGCCHCAEKKAEADKKTPPAKPAEKKSSAKDGPAPAPKPIELKEVTPAI